MLYCIYLDNGLHKPCNIRNDRTHLTRLHSIIVMSGYVTLRQPHQLRVNGIFKGIFHQKELACLGLPPFFDKLFQLSFDKPLSVKGGGGETRFSLRTNMLQIGPKTVFWGKKNLFLVKQFLIYIRP